LRSGGEEKGTGHRLIDHVLPLTQAYLRFVGLYFKVVPSSNHASPSGVLPFLQPAVEKKGDTSVPDAVPGNKLKKWLDGQKWLRQAKETDDVRFDAYASLIESRVRKAWVSTCRVEDIDPTGGGTNMP
jgi:hypothetical protein